MTYISAMYVAKACSLQSQSHLANLSLFVLFIVTQRMHFNHSRMNLLSLSPSFTTIIKTGLDSPVLHKNWSRLSCPGFVSTPDLEKSSPFCNENYFQLPLSKRSLVHNSFFLNSRALELPTTFHQMIN